MENKPQEFNAPETKLHFLDYWRIIRIRKTVILAVFLLVSVTTAVITYILPKSYASTVRMRVEKDVPDIAPIGGQPTVMNFDPYWIQTEFEKIQSKSILYPVITNLDLRTRYAERYKDPNMTMEETYRVLRGQIDVRQYRNTSIIEVRAYSEDPAEAARIANMIAEVYRTNRIALRTEMTQRGIATLEEELARQNALVREKQKLVDELKEKYNISDIETTGYAYSVTPETETPRRLEAERIAAQTEYEKLNTLYSQLTNLAPAELRHALASASPELQLQLNELLSQLALADQQYVDKLVSFGEKHPEVLRLNSIRQLLHKQVDEKVQGIMEGLAIRVAAAKAAVDRLQAEVEKAKERDVEAAKQRREYYLAKRDLENLQNVRDRLQMRIQQEKVDAALPRAGIVEIIDRAEPSDRAVRPNPILNITLGIIFGLMLGIGLAFFIEYLDTSVKTIDDVERALQAPVLGVIPQNVGNLIEDGPESPHAEAYRVLRTNILFSQKDPKLNTLTVVSAGAGEGKSTTVFNLATVFAQSGQRVLLVDSDLRRPSLHKMFKVSNSIGLTNYLLRQNSLEEVIQTTPVATLDFMPSGKLPSSSMGLLGSSQMKELIRDLKRRYDWVFFDSPPIMGVSDASILASEVDMVLMVIQYRRYPQPMTTRAKQMIEKVGGNLLGIVLNNISIASDSNYYYYSGYYYYASGEHDSGKSSEAKAAGQSESKVEIESKY